MYTALILREEALCFIILMFLLVVGFVYSMGQEKHGYMLLTLYALGHVVFDALSVITVNIYEGAGGFFGIANIFTALYHLFGILFCCELFKYTVGKCFPKRIASGLWALYYILPALYLVSLPFFGITYHNDKCIYVSGGPSVTGAYIMCFTLVIAGLAGVIFRYRRLEHRVRRAILPIYLLILAVGLAQFFYKEFLFSGASVTVAVFGVFFSLENPDLVFKQKMLTDALTGVKSRNAYEEDAVAYEKKYSQGASLCVAFFDINDLKAVNDIHGHLEGDSYISCIASILINCLDDAEGLYRMGGDEFMTVFINKDESTIRAQIESVSTACEVESSRRKYRVSVAVGCAARDEKFGCFKDVLRAADYMMYENKVTQKKLRALNLFEGGAVNRSGLTERIFNAFANIENTDFYFVTNLDTGVTRWSAAAVDEFELKDEFIFDFGNEWKRYIHPDDSKLFFDGLYGIMTGMSENFMMELRAMNRTGKYTPYICRGTLLKARGREPALFAGVLRRKSD